MRSKKKQVGIFILGALCFGLVILPFLRPAESKLIVPLADGSSFTLVGTDSGSLLFYGGGRWQTILCKALRRQLPAFIHNQPEIWTSSYTNGIALCFCREKPGGLQTAWNGTGQLYFLDDSGVEHQVRNHCVGFVTEKRGQVETVVEENMHWELPMQHDAELRFSPTGNPPALPEDSRSLTAPGVDAESIFREPLKVYERRDDAHV